MDTKPDYPNNLQLMNYTKELAKIYESEKEIRNEQEISNKKLRSTLEGVKDGIVSLDENNII